MITYDNYHYIFRLSKRTIPLLKKKNRFTEVLEREGRNDKANNKIIALIRSNKPFMVARYGSTESKFIVNFLEQNKKQGDLTAIYRHLKGSLNIFWKKDKSFLDNLCSLSGFFPNDENLASDFVDLMLECTKNLDILGIWNNLEEFIPNIPNDTYICKIRELEPWFYNEPWSKYLEDKKILVIHPFESSIKEQYYKNIRGGGILYKNKYVLPKFQLKTIKAIQSIAGEPTQFDTWFDALEDMKKQINNIDFDIAIIGCGAYGFPLASYIKDIGKQAIHLGGVTQLLFGIKGKRWEGWQHYTDLRIDNGKNWIIANEIPINYKDVENGCYW